MLTSYMKDSELRKTGGVLWLVGGLMAVALVFALATGGPDRPVITDALGELANPSQVYDPVEAGETLPSGYRQLLGRDSILPVYEPAFVSAGETEWAAETLVIGVAEAGTAKAYPVSHLNRREMVVDSLDGIPILVTW